jgi:hypothetical protein
MPPNLQNTKFHQNELLDFFGVNLVILCFGGKKGVFSVCVTNPVNG